MLQSPGPVNMEIARKTADESATHDPETGEEEPEPVIASRGGRCIRRCRARRRNSRSPRRRASRPRSPSRPARPIGKRGPTPPCRGSSPCSPRSRAALGRGPAAPEGDDPAAASPEAFLGMLMQQLVPLLLGAWSGSMIGALSHHALGQYDLPLPLTGDPAMLFVVHNVEAFGRSGPCRSTSFVTPSRCERSCTARNARSRGSEIAWCAWRRAT